MDIKDAMVKAGADYSTVLSRFMGNESLLKRFVKKFAEDPTYDQLKTYVEQRDAENIYLSGHTLKGVSSNLGFDKLSALCAETILTARDKDVEDAAVLFQKLQTEYETVLDLIRMID